MGSGKGALEYWVAVVKPGRVMFEIAGVPEETAKEALRLATHKLPVKCKIVSKADLDKEVNRGSASRLSQRIKRKVSGRVAERVSSC